MPNDGARAVVKTCRPERSGRSSATSSHALAVVGCRGEAMKERIVARIRRDKDGSWLVTFPDIRGAHTYGRSLNQLRRRIPELLRLWDRDPVHVDLVEVLDLPNNIRQAISVATKQRLELEQRSQAVQRDMERTIRRLQSQLKLGVRDSGELLGISPQYAHKLRHRKDASRSAKVRKAASTRLPR